MSTTGRRPYHSERRRAQASATRAAIVDAATVQFLALGYARTTMAGIAETARVSPETTYAVFGTKRAVLSAALDRAITGDDEAVPLLERAWVRDLVAEPDRDRRVAALARHGSRILARRTPLDRVLREAAAGDPEARELLDRARADRYRGQRSLLGIVAGGERALDPSLDVAADTLFALGSPEVYELLTGVRRWTHDAFERWYAQAIRGLMATDPDTS